jgi:hypothetical protein
MMKLFYYSKKKNNFEVMSSGKVFRMKFCIYVDYYFLIKVTILLSYFSEINKFDLRHLLL